MSPRHLQHRPQVYKGLDLKTGHAHLRITDEHYDAVIDNLFLAVLHFLPSPPPAVVAALVGLTESVRGMVVRPPAARPPPPPPRSQ